MLTKPDISKPVFQHPDFKTEAILTQIGMCPMCTQPIHEEDFTDALSKREYTISGMCQKCQDEMFSDPDED